MKTKKQALAQHLGMNQSDLSDYRYHFGRTTQAVFSFEDGYYCVTKGKEKPAIHRDGMEFNWERLEDNFVSSFGYNIWKSEITKI